MSAWLIITVLVHGVLSPSTDHEVRLSRAEKYLHDFRLPGEKNSKLTIAIMHSDRSLTYERRSDYLTVAIAELIEQLNLSRASAEVLICDTSIRSYNHPTLHLLQSRITINRLCYGDSALYDSELTLRCGGMMGRDEKHTVDLLFCADKALLASSAPDTRILILEDDHVINSPFSGIIEISRRSEQVIKLSSSYSQRGYFGTFYNSCQLFLASAVITVILSRILLFRRRTRSSCIMLACVTYLAVTVVLMALGRPSMVSAFHWLSGLRVYSPCARANNGAVLYSKSALYRVSSSLRSQNMQVIKELDFNLHDIYQQLGLRCVMAEPPVFDHIGLYSSLHDNNVLVPP